MDLDDRLVRDIRKNGSPTAGQDPYYQEEPDWMVYEDRKMETPLNEYKGIYDEKDHTSINKAPSVFDRGTIFRTGESGKK